MSFVAWQTDKISQIATLGNLHEKNKPSILNRSRENIYIPLRLNSLSAKEAYTVWIWKTIINIMWKIKTKLPKYINHRVA